MRQELIEQAVESWNRGDLYPLVSQMTPTEAAYAVGVVDDQADDTDEPSAVLVAALAWRDAMLKGKGRRLSCTETERRVIKRDRMIT